MCGCTFGILLGTCLQALNTLNFEFESRFHSSWLIISALSDWMGNVCELPSLGIFTDVLWGLNLSFGWAIPEQSTDIWIPKPLQHCLGCVLRVIVVLRGEPSVWGCTHWSCFSLRNSDGFTLQPNSDQSPCVLATQTGCTWPNFGVPRQSIRKLLK